MSRVEGKGRSLSEGRRTRIEAEEQLELSGVGEEDEHKMAGSSGAQLGLTR